MTIYQSQTYFMNEENTLVEVKQCQVHPNRLDIYCHRSGHDHPFVESVPKLNQATDLPTLTWENYGALHSYSFPLNTLASEAALKELKNQVTHKGLSGIYVAFHQSFVVQVEEQSNVAFRAQFLGGLSMENPLAVVEMTRESSFRFI